MKLQNLSGITQLLHCTRIWKPDMQRRPAWRMGQETEREMTSSFGIPDSASGPGTASQGNPRMAGPGTEVEGYGGPCGGRKRGRHKT